jgi:hypothetical protein
MIDSKSERIENQMLGKGEYLAYVMVSMMKDMVRYTKVDGVWMDG